MNPALAAHAPAAEDPVRADCYRVLSRLFAAPPDAALLQHLRHAASGADADELGGLWNALCAAGAADEAALTDEYAELFLGVGSPKVNVYGSWYRTGAMMDMPLAHLRADLARLGLSRHDDVKEPEDHIAAVLEVMGLLAAAGNDAQGEFFRCHLAPWYEAFCAAVAAQQESVLYPAAARFARGFLAGEREMLTR